MSGDPRRRIPRTDDVLADPLLAEAVRLFGRERVKAVVTSSQQQARAGLLAPEAVVDAALASLQTLPPGFRAVINATGVIVHTNLGRAALSTAARAALVEAAGATDVEFDLQSGERARRGRGTLAALAEAVPAAGDVHVVNNNAAALLLCALTLAPGKEIVLSRGEMVEIGDGFRIPELLASTGSVLREVGATNRTSLSDYRDAIGPETGFILKVHPSNFQITGFTSAVEVAELTKLGVPVVVDIGSGLLTPHPLLPDEPDAATALRDGATVVTASGDKLLGGPQAGLLLGEAAVVQRLRRHPAARALRVDKLVLAALEATLRGPVPPVRQALDTPADQLRARADRLAAALSAQQIDAAVVPSRSTIGGGSAPGVDLPSWAISLPSGYAVALRTAATAVVGRVAEGRCLLDLRTVDPDDDDRLLAGVAKVHDTCT
ncbi:MAG TPA: L-seryl-tRNA(Sec) selenium transferase [Kribbella sp.]|uniref:L-seryl-tRNA(Sec) selenium transferase n=1 Tax=Kribbella sp. TaxID=1871183 RepID=UPI002D76B1FE|nr:L-seryl-tRNA(Sec) selenium transferase [Kribbella sp.]HET6296274.1 L-seryl-tRNA(Sec) selenium transferase [Kribbella sp.]